MNSMTSGKASPMACEPLKDDHDQVKQPFRKQVDNGSENMLRYAGYVL
jgi:hypothetical protein